VAEPWSRDFDALAERSREHLRSLEATRASLSTRSQETKMRFFKSHPALTALAAVAMLALVSGAAYAVVREVFVTIDPDKPAPEIEQDIHQQLESAGVPSTVHVDKSDDGQLKVRIGTTDRDVSSDLQVHVNGVNGAPSESRSLRMELEETCQLDEAQNAALEATASSPAIIALVTDRGDKSDADLAPAISQVFHDAGFLDVDVSVADGTVKITVKAPPVTP
jgi:hypothetical protein